MTMEQFLMLLDEHFGNFEEEIKCGYFLCAYGSQKRAFKTLSDYRWALRELSKYVEDEIGCSYEPTEIYKFMESVVGFEYQMDVYANVNPDHRMPFENARVIAEEVEDILNAMI